MVSAGHTLPSSARHNILVGEEATANAPVAQETNGGNGVRAGWGLHERSPPHYPGSLHCHSINTSYVLSTPCVLSAFLLLIVVVVIVVIAILQAAVRMHRALPLCSSMYQYSQFVGCRSKCADTNTSLHLLPACLPASACLRQTFPPPLFFGCKALRLSMQRTHLEAVCSRRARVLSVPNADTQVKIVKRCRQW